MNKELYTQQAMCRGCLVAEKENLKNIFEIEINLIKVSEMFTSLVRIPIQPNDSFPKTICDVCLESLVQAYNFKKMCILSNNKLVSIFNYNLLKKNGEQDMQTAYPSHLLNDHLNPIGKQNKKDNKQSSSTDNSANGSECSKVNSTESDNLLHIPSIEENLNNAQRRQHKIKTNEGNEDQNKEKENDKMEKHIFSSENPDINLKEFSDDAAGDNTEQGDSIDNAQNNKISTSITVEVSRQPLGQTILVEGRKFRLVRIKRKTTIAASSSQENDNSDIASTSETDQSRNEEIPLENETVNNKRPYSILDLNGENDSPISNAINDKHNSLSIKRVKSLALMNDVQKKSISKVPMVLIPTTSNSSKVAKCKTTMPLNEKSENDVSSNSNINAGCSNEQLTKLEIRTENKLEIMKNDDLPNENIPKSVLKPKINIIQNWSKPIAPKKHVHYCKQCDIRFSNSINLVKHKISRHLDDIRPDLNQTKQTKNKKYSNEAMEIIDISHEDNSMDVIDGTSEIKRDDAALSDTSSIEFIPDEEPDIIDLGKDDKSNNSSEEKCVVSLKKIESETEKTGNEPKTEHSKETVVDENYGYKRCTKCFLKLPVEILKQHTQISHRLCVICSFRFNTITDLMQHSCQTMQHENNPRSLDESSENNLFTIKSEGSFKCKLCNQNCKTAENLLNHEKLFHDCSICEFKFKSVQILKVHLNNHALKELQCPKRDKCFKNTENLDNHMRTSHQELSNDSKKMKCDICSKQYVKISFLRDHLLKKHFIEKNEKLLQYSCTLCNISFSNVSFYNLHRRESKHKDQMLKHYMKLHSNGSKPLNTVNAITETLTNHSDLPGNPKDSKSTSCSKASDRTQTTEKVEENVPTENVANKIKPWSWKYECEVCHRALRTWDKYKFHMKSVHDKLQSLFCDPCKKRFSNNVTLKEHLNEIHKQDVFMCDVHPCTESFNQWTDFKNHRITNHPLEDMNFCDICKRIFVSKAYLGFHMFKHSKEEIRMSMIA